MLEDQFDISDFISERGGGTYLVAAGRPSFTFRLTLAAPISTPGKTSF